MLSYVVAKGKYRKDCTESHQRSHSGTVARQLPFTDSHAAAIKHTVIAIENTIGRIKRYLQLTTVIAAKQTTNAHTAPRICAKVSAETRPSCHANIAAKK